MKRIFILLISVSLVLSSCNKKKISTPHLSSQKDTIAYFIGAVLGKQLKGQVNNIEENFGLGKIDKKIFAQVVEDVLSGDSIKYTDMYMNQRVMAYIDKIRKESGEKNLKEGVAFLEKNKTNPGVIVTPSGLQYQVIKQGNGPKPDSSNRVVVNYKGSLVNGEVFETNNGVPLSVVGVIPGWTEALLKMNVGSKWKIFIPANLAYGENPRQGGKIKPNMTLIFELELLSIEPKQPQQAQPMQAPAMKPMMMPRRK